MQRIRLSLGLVFLAFCCQLDALAQVSSQALPTLVPPTKATLQAVQNAPDEVSLWVDHFLRDLDRELAQAAELGVEPLRITGPDSVAEIGSGGRVFKWVVSSEGELLGLPTFNKGELVRGHVVAKDDVIKHSVATRGRPVWAAGNARVIGKKIFIDRRSGHYQPKAPSFQIAKQKFQAAGLYRPRLVGQFGVGNLRIVRTFGESSLSTPTTMTGERASLRVERP
jgi:hypothetical protein